MGRVKELEMYLQEKDTNISSIDDDYLETYFEVVQHLVLTLDNEYSKSFSTREAEGIGGLYTLAKQWTNEFQRKYKNYFFDGDWLDKIDDFLLKKENE